MEEHYKLYKTISETLVPNVASIGRSMEIVKNFIKQRGLILYGGMSIDFILRHFKRGSLYDENLLPDYDFFSPDNVRDSVILANTLIANGYVDVRIVNARHLTTRRLKINEHDIVADISYYPEPYFSQLPFILIDDIKVLHPDFQKIDFYRSITYLYEGFPKQAYYTKRLYKDILKLNRIEMVPATPVLKIQPITGDLMVVRSHASTKFHISEMPVNCVISGILALAIICEIYKVDFEFKMQQEMDLPCMPEFFVENPEIYVTKKSEFYYKTKDILPSGHITNNIVYYDNRGSLITCNKTIYGNVVNAHYLAALFLFKHYMMGGYYRYYEICRRLISGVENTTLTMLRVTNEEPVEMPSDVVTFFIDNPLESPLTINGTFYGKTNVHPSWYYHELKEKCLIKGKKTHFRPPKITCKHPLGCKVKKSRYPITYKVDGSRCKTLFEKPKEC